MKDIELWHGDCLDITSRIPNQRVDLAICDLPYSHRTASGSRKPCTSNTWDTPLDLAALWAQLDRVCSPDAVIIFFCNFLFGAEVCRLRPQYFRYDLIWEKSRAVGFLDANRKPLRAHETVLVFSRAKAIYNPQKFRSSSYPSRNDRRINNYGATQHVNAKGSADGTRYPRSVLKFAQDGSGGIHPTAKPLALIEYLIRTYSNKGQLVLDPTMGSGTTGHACVLTGRKFIGIERNRPYFDIAVERVNKALAEREGAAQ